MNINILRYSLFGIAGGQEVDHTVVKLLIRLGNECKQQTLFVCTQTKYFAINETQMHESIQLPHLHRNY